MPGKFCIYSTDIAPTTEPYNSSPSTLIRFDRDPIVEGTYEVEEGVFARGSVNPTLGGANTQNFGSYDTDTAIRISDSDALSESTRNALRTAYTGSGEYFFTDGYECWRVIFKKDRPIRLRRNLALAHFGRNVFSYEINLQALVKEI